MGKPDFSTCKIKGANQVRSNWAAAHWLCFRYTTSTICHLPKYSISSLLPIYGGCTARVVSDQARNPEGRASRDVAQNKR